MKPGAGKRKGSSFERWVAKQLSLWLTHGQDHTQLIRSVLSGGWSERTARQVGDLSPNGPTGESFRKVFGVECKHQREIDLWDLWTLQDGGKIGRWWKKLCAEVGTTPCLSEPMLVMRANRRPDMVALRTRFLQERGLPVDAPLANIWRYGLTLLPFSAMLDMPPEWFLET